MHTDDLEEFYFVNFRTSSCNSSFAKLHSVNNFFAKYQYDVTLSVLAKIIRANNVCLMEKALYYISNVPSLPRVISLPLTMRSA